jgi:hypothetical protein
MQKYFVVILIGSLLYVSCCLGADQSNEPIKFNYGSIPFGKTIPEVMKLIGGMKCVENQTLTISKYEGLRKYFDKGLYALPTDEYEMYLNFNLIKKYSMVYDNDDVIRQVDLYFTKEKSTSDTYRLFIVRKLLKTIDDHFENVFNQFKDMINSQLKVTPDITTTTYTLPLGKDFETTEIADMGVWFVPHETVFLFVPNLISSAGIPEILYVSNKDLKSYLKACKKEEGKTVKEPTPQKDKMADAF